MKRKGSHERSFGPDRLAEEEEDCDPESQSCPDLSRVTLGSLVSFTLPTGTALVSGSGRWKCPLLLEDCSHVLIEGPDKVQT